MTDFLTAGDSAELCFGLGLIVWGMAWLIARRINRRRLRRIFAPYNVPTMPASRPADACTHPAWRVERLAYNGAGQAVKISCQRCHAPALDRFTAEALRDGTISLVNATPHVQNLVFEGALHELLPARMWSEYEDDAQESTYAVFLQPPDNPDSAYLRKL